MIIAYKLKFYNKLYFFKSLATFPTELGNCFVSQGMRHLLVTSGNGNTNSSVLQMQLSPKTFFEEESLNLPERDTARYACCTQPHITLEWNSTQSTQIKFSKIFKDKVIDSIEVSLDTFVKWSLQGTGIPLYTSEMLSDFDIKIPDPFFDISELKKVYTKNEEEHHTKLSELQKMYSKNEEEHLAKLSERQHKNEEEYLAKITTASGSAFEKLNILLDTVTQQTKREHTLEYTALERKISDLEKELEKCHEKLLDETHNIEIESWKNKCDTLELNCQEWKNKCGTLELDCKEWKRKSDAENYRVTLEKFNYNTFQSRHDTLKTEVESWKNKCDNLEKGCEELIRRNNSELIKYNILKTEHDALKIKHEHLIKSCNDWDTERGYLMKNCNEWENSFDQWEIERNDFKAKNDTLEQKIKKLETERDTLKAANETFGKREGGDDSNSVDNNTIKTLEQRLQNQNDLINNMEASHIQRMSEKDAYFLKQMEKINQLQFSEYQTQLAVKLQEQEKRQKEEYQIELDLKLKEQEKLSFNVYTQFCEQFKIDCDKEFLIKYRVEELSSENHKLDKEVTRLETLMKDHHPDNHPDLIAKIARLTGEIGEKDKKIVVLNEKHSFDLDAKDQKIAELEAELTKAQAQMQAHDNSDYLLVEEPKSP